MYTATVVGSDENKDIAVLALDCPPEVVKKLKPVVLGSSASLLVGQQVYAIGNPFGLDHTLTQGIISGVGREINAGIVPIKGVIQTDAAINPGNSGTLAQQLTGASLMLPRLAHAFCVSGLRVVLSANNDKILEFI